MVNVFFVHNSPIQVLNAHEAKRKYCSSDEKAILIIFVKNKTRSFDQVLGVLNKDQWDEVILLPMKTMIESINRYFTLEELANKWHVKRVFTSMLGSHPIYHFVNCVKEENKNLDVIFFDEGTHSIFALKEIDGINLFAKEFYYNSLKLFFKEKFLGVRLSPIKISEVFSLYAKDLKTVPCKVNRYDYIKSMIDTKECEDYVIFLGQHLYLGEVSKLQYLYYLEQVASYYKDQKVYYIPHRYERQEILEEIERMNFFEINTLDDCIEFSLLKRDKYPREISGFTSSALFNIKHIFEDRFKVRSFEIPNEEISSRFTKRMASIYEHYKTVMKLTPITGMRATTTSK